MNKLVVDNSIQLSDMVIDTDTDMEVNLVDTEKDITIHIGDGVCVKSFINNRNTKNKVRYLIGENANVVINKLSVDCSDDLELILNGYNANLKYNTSVINYGDNSCKQIVRHSAKNVTSKIVNHAINVDNNSFKFIVDGIIERNASKVDFKQDNKITNLKDGKSNILPNLIVDNDDVLASHSAYVGTFDPEIKFYMMSRGLTEKECDDLLIKAFLLNDMDLSSKERDIYCSIIESINK